MGKRLFLAVVVSCAASVVPSAQSDLDAFMSTVLERRDGNWKKLQQYVLEETESFQLTGPAGARLYGFKHEYSWFPRDGVFIRSPRRADGVAISEADRRTAEEKWLRQEQRREQQRAGGEGEPVARADSANAPLGIDAVVRQSVEPQFVSTAYFLRFKFEQGHYALAGRERFAGRDVLRIEYYPDKLSFGDDEEDKDSRQKKEDRRQKTRDRGDAAEDEEYGKRAGKGHDEEARIERQMNKVALITLWVEPIEHQIVQYEFRNIDFDFLPGRSFVRLDGLKASMRMGQPFAGVWLPDSIAMAFQMTLAIGDVAARYDVHYRDYRLATVATRLR